MSSYATREEADAFLSSLLGMDGWDKADGAEKERALATATLHLDALEASPGLRGNRKDPEQAQAFPRSFEADISDTVKHACCLEAAALLEEQSDGSASRRRLAIRQGVASVSVGNTSESYRASSELSGGMRGCLSSEEASVLILPYLAGRVVPIR